MQKNGLIRKLKLTLKFMTSQTGKQIIARHKLLNMSKTKGSQAMQLTQLIEYNMINIFLQKTMLKNVVDKLVPEML